MGKFVPSEHFMAEQWRKDVMKLTRPALAELTGYSVAHIQNMERGYNAATKQPTKPREMQRYRMVCAAVMVGVHLDWETARFDARPLAEGMIASKRTLEMVA